ncbi:MAG: MBL fold metallo-hydrolase [Ruminococcus sp.]|nr:MBL fold metallo-hydrolase [Ruminococcus sp.]
MRVYQLLPLSVCDTNSYIVASDSNNCVLIDAPDEADYILEQIDLFGLTLKKILLTHGHFDHVGAVAELVRKTGCEVYIHQNDLSRLADGDASAGSVFGIRSAEGFKDGTPFGDGDVITLDELEFEVLHTPGHTPGSCCFLIDDCMFTGDTLFARSIGRTDLPGGDMAQMHRSLLKIHYLFGDYKIYPGHMKVTTLDKEKKYNPYLCDIGDF